MRQFITSICVLSLYVTAYPQFVPSTLGVPVWSNDGAQLLFESTDGIYTVSSDGVNVNKVTDGQSPSWTADGRIVFRGTGGFYTVNADGSQRVLLFAGGISVSPNGNKVLFVEKAGQGGSLKMVLKAINTDTQVVTELYTLYDSDRLGGFVWSPDSNKIAFQIARGQGMSEPVVLTVIPNYGVVPGNEGGPFSWAPDSNHILLTRYDRNKRVFSVYIVDIGTRTETLLFETVVYVGSLSLSPDGKRIALALFSNDTWDIFVRDIDGTESVRLTSNPDQEVNQEVNLSWSPDGTRIAYATYGVDGSGILQVHILDVEGGHSVTEVESLSWGKVKATPQ